MGTEPLSCCRPFKMFAGTPAASIPEIPCRLLWTRVPSFQRLLTLDFDPKVSLVSGAGRLHEHLQLCQCLTEL